MTDKPKEFFSKQNIKNITRKILDKHSDGKFPVKVIHLAESLGLEVFRATFDREGISGMLEANKQKISVNAQESEERRRFSIAHEIGHYILHHQGAEFEESESEKHISYRDDLSSQGFDLKEVEANFFAANLLMPEIEVRRLYDDGWSLGEMASYFYVSRSAMGYRLAYLELV